jgi:hypothetical protein
MQSARPQLEPPQIVSSEHEQLDSINTNKDKRYWNEWLKELLKPQPEPTDYMNAVIDAFGGKHKNKTVRRK